MNGSPASVALRLAEVLIIQMKTSLKLLPMDTASPKRALWLVGGMLLVVAAGVMFLVPHADPYSPVKDGSQNSHSQGTGHKAKRGARDSDVAYSIRNAPTVGPNGLHEKEQMANDILSSGRPIDQMADDLLVLFPECAGATQSLVASHLTHLVDEKQMDKLLQFLGDPKINQVSKEEIFTSIYQRDPDEAAAFLIKVIEVGNSKFVSEAQNALAVLLAANHGNDAVAWKSELESQKKTREAE